LQENQDNTGIEINDGVDSIRILGNKKFGFEERFGGEDLDYNDVVVQVNFAEIINVNSQQIRGYGLIGDISCKRQDVTRDKHR